MAIRTVYALSFDPHCRAALGHDRIAKGSGAVPATPSSCSLQRNSGCGSGSIGNMAQNALQSGPEIAAPIDFRALLGSRMKPEHLVCLCYGFAAFRFVKPATTKRNTMKTLMGVLFAVAMVFSSGTASAECRQVQPLIRTVARGSKCRSGRCATAAGGTL